MSGITNKSECVLEIILSCLFVLILCVQTPLQFSSQIRFIANKWYLSLVLSRGDAEERRFVSQ